MHQVLRQQKDNFETRQVDHLGIVATCLDQLALDKLIDEMIPFPRGKIPASQRFKALILNCFGFVKKPLYITPNFLKKKDFKVLISDKVTPEDFNDDCLARFLDRIVEIGPCEFFQKLALAVFEKTQISHDNSFKIDTTSFSLFGDYKDQTPGSVQAIKGFSKDHRPDLNQIICSLICVGKQNFPISVDIHSGNASDKKTILERIENTLKQFTENLEISSNTIWLADSAMYNQKLFDLEKKFKFKWITRVPNTTKNVKKSLLEASYAREESHCFYENWIQDFDKKDLSYFEVNDVLKNLPHRFIVVHSEKLLEKEKKSFEKKLQKERDEAIKLLKKLQRKEFACEKDALEEVEFQKKQKSFFEIQVKKVIEKRHFLKKGKPKKNESAHSVSYTLELVLVEKTTLIEEAKNQLGLFVLGTNLSKKEKSPSEILRDYKSLQGVEKGFRFLKDPGFFLDHFFFKKVTRISAVISIMAFTLLMYGLIENSIREACCEKDESVPNLAGRPQKNPTGILCFQYFQGFSSIIFRESESKSISFFEKLTEVQKKILCLLGPPYEKFYGIA